MSKKFIPNGDLDFVRMAESFTRSIADDPQRFEVTRADAEELSAVVARFAAAVQACRTSGRSQAATLAKDEARADAERIVRRLGHLVRANLRLDAATKILVGIRQRQEKAKI